MDRDSAMAVDGLHVELIAVERVLALGRPLSRNRHRHTERDGVIAVGRAQSRNGARSDAEREQGEEHARSRAEQLAEPDTEESSHATITSVGLTGSGPACRPTYSRRPALSAAVAG